MTMKKLALSAAILAMTMMGCSESGVNNASVSGTGSILDEKSLEYFKGITEFKEVSGSKSALVLKKSDDEIREGGAMYVDPNEKYALIISSDVFDPNLTGNNNKGQHFMSVNSKSNIGPNYCGPYPSQWCLFYGSNFLHMYGACVRGCSSNGICQEHQLITAHQGPSCNYGQERWCNNIVSSNPDEIGLITTASVVIEGGNVILQGATRKNLSNDMALKVYYNYVLQEVLADAGLL